MSGENGREARPAPPEAVAPAFRPGRSPAGAEAAARRQAAEGLALLGALIVAGLLLLLVAQRQGAAPWLADGFVLLAAAAAGLYVPFVHRPERGLGRRAGAAERRSEEVERLLGAALAALAAGDLVRCAAAAEGLPGQLSGSLAGGARALVLLAQQMQGSSKELAGEAAGVRQVASDLASGAVQQAASVSEITAATEELARTAAAIAETAAAQAALAQRARDGGEAGARAVEQAVAGLEEVEKRIAGIAGRAETLAARSREIYRLLDLTTEIAHETHMLSLNAAIEAAAAGEHGGRFGVVADEVRRLAERSRQSIDSVRRLLDELAASIASTVAAGAAAGAEVERALRSTRAAASTIEALRDAAVESARVARETSLATQQQTAASEDVVATLREVSRVVARTAAGLRQFSSTAGDLNQLGLALQLLAQSFHLDSPHSLKATAERWAAEVEGALGSWSAVERLVETLAQDRPFVECLYFVDARDGQTALAVNRGLLGGREVPASLRAGEGFADRPWFTAATAERRTVITPLFTSLLTGEPTFTAASPLYDGGGALVGVLGLDVNVENWTTI